MERYDRVHKRGPDASLERLHQEDFCQAQGMVSERKYQKEGGPSLRQCFGLLRSASSTPVIDLARLLEATFITTLSVTTTRMERISRCSIMASELQTWKSGLRRFTMW